MHSNNVEHLTGFPLLLHLLERGDVGVLVRRQQKESRLHPHEFRILPPVHQADPHVRQVEETQRHPQQALPHVPLLATPEGEALQDLQQVRVVLRPPLPLHLQLRGFEEQDLVLPICHEHSRQLFLHYLLRHVLHCHRRIWDLVCIRAVGGIRVLWPGMDFNVYIGKKFFLLIASKLSPFFEHEPQVSV